MKQSICNFVNREFLTSLQQTLCLGIKIQTIEKGQVIMDLDFKWGGDPSIILAVKTPVGANLPIQVS